MDKITYLIKKENKIMRKNKPFWIGIIIGIVLIVGITVSPIIIELNIELNKPKPPLPTYPNADITRVQYFNGSGSIITNPEYLRIGFHNSDGVYEEREHFRSILQFDISDVDFECKSCVFSAYQSSINDNYNRGRYNVYLSVNSSWDESFGILDFNWSNEGVNIDWETITNINHIEYNISNYMKNAFSVSIRIGFQNGHLTEADNSRDAYFEIYSRDSDIDNKYKPQLIWS